MKDTINHEIVAVAESYVGKEEILGNLGFKDEEFERRMKACGWKENDAWCSYFTELVWKEAYQQWDATIFSRLDKLFSGSAVETYRNFSKTKDFLTANKPLPGALSCWQTYKEGKPHWTGHIGIVQSVDFKNGKYTCIEGNTNDKGGREGYIVAIKNRELDFSVKNGLVLVGFINPKTI